MKTVRGRARTLGKIQSALEGTFFVIDFLLKLQDRIEYGFGPRRASGNVNIHGNHLIAALHDGVIVEDAAGRGARTH